MQGKQAWYGPNGPGNQASGRLASMLVSTSCCARYTPKFRSTLYTGMIVQSFFGIFGYKHIKIWGVPVICLALPENYLVYAYTKHMLNGNSNNKMENPCSTFQKNLDFPCLYPQNLYRPNGAPKISKTPSFFCVCWGPSRHKHFSK